MIVFFFGLGCSDWQIGFIMTMRWSEGLPFPSRSLSRAGRVVGGRKYLARVVIILSKIASGFFLVGI